MRTERMKEEEATFSALLDSLPCPALIVDREHRVRAVNAALRDRVPDRRVGPRTHCYELLHGRRGRCPSPRRDCPLERCLGSGVPIPALHRHVVDGRRRRERILLRPLVGADGSIVACLGTIDAAGPAAARARRAPTLSGATFASVRDRLPATARGHAPVFLVGETGTGKASLACAIHRASGTRGPYEERSSRELDAASLRALLASAPRGGTLYLSEVDALDVDSQEAVVEALARREGWRLVAGSERDLAPLVTEGRFHAGLARRLSARCLRLPPVRERAGELRRAASRLLRLAEGPGRVLSAGALERLERYPFPGNFDELEQALRHASLMANGATVQADDLPAWVGPTTAAAAGSGPRGRTPRGSTAR